MFLNIRFLRKIFANLLRQHDHLREKTKSTYITENGIPYEILHLLNTLLFLLIYNKYCYHTFYVISIKA